MDLKTNAAADVNINLLADKSWNDNIAIAEEKPHEVSRIKGEKSKKQSAHTHAHSDHDSTSDVHGPVGK